MYGTVVVITWERKMENHNFAVEKCIIGAAAPMV